jgi:hypothetical protein
VVQVGVTGGDDQIVMLVLKLGELFAYAVRMVVIDQGDGSHDNGVRSGGSLADQAVANQIAKSLGAVGISAPAHPLIELLEKIGIQRNADSAENAHTHSCDNS